MKLWRSAGNGQAAAGKRTQAPHNAARGFRPDIEGLRAIAVILVVLGHAGTPGLAGGYIGVDMFFVLSGFLITEQLLKERATRGSTSLAGFYGRRARRILPAATLVLVVTVAVSREWLGPLRAAAIAEDGRMAAVFASNLHFASEGTQYLNVSAPPSPLQHYWSLAVEEQFYLVWPLLFLATAVLFPKVSLTWKLAGVLGAVILASFAWSVIQTGSNPVWAFFSPLTRAWELAVGALLTVGASRLRTLPARFAACAGWAGLALAVAPAMFFDAGTGFPGAAAALPVFGTAAVLAAGVSAPRFGPELVLRMAPLQFVGKLSYSLYLWHWPLLIIPEQRAGEALSGWERAALMAVAFVLAVATHYVVENPIRYSRVLITRPVPSVAFGACLVVACYGFAGWHLSQLPTRLGPQAAGAAGILEPGEAPSRTPAPVAPEPSAVDEGDILASVAAAERMVEMPPGLVDSLSQAAWDFAWLSDEASARCVPGEEVTEPVSPCEFGDVGADTNVVLLGDSHAAQWLSAFDRLGKENGWKVTLLSKAGCPVPSLELARAFLGGPRRLLRENKECPLWLERAIARVNQLQPDVLVLGSCAGCEYMANLDGSALTREQWADGLRKTFGRLDLPPEDMVLIADVPRLPGVLDCIATNAEDARKCAMPRAEALGVTYNDTEAAVAAERGVQYLDVTPWFCGQVCPPVISGVVAYTNEYHMTSSYGRLIAPLLEPAIVEALEAQPR